MAFYRFRRHSLPSGSCNLSCRLYSCWEGLGSSSLAICPWVSLVVLFPPLHVGRPLGFAPEAALEDLGLPHVRTRCGGGAAAWVAGVLAAPGTQGVGG